MVDRLAVRIAWRTIQRALHVVRGVAPDLLGRVLGRDRFTNRSVRVIDDALAARRLIVERIIGKEELPTEITVCKFKPKPRRMTAYCKTFFETKLIL